MKVLDLSHTYIRILPIEICQLKQLYDLNLDECPLNPKVYDVYKSGIVYLVKYYAEKMQRENLRQKIVNAAKAQVWIDADVSQIQDSVGRILEDLENDDISLVQRLLRNLKYTIPMNIEKVDPYVIKMTLLTSKIGTPFKYDNTHSQLNNSISKAMNFNPKDINRKSGMNTVQFESSKISNPTKEYQSDIISIHDQPLIDTETVLLQSSTIIDEEKEPKSKTESKMVNAKEKDKKKAKK